MPTWLIERGYRFGIYAVDCDEPPHVHVRGHGGAGKIWLASLEVAYLRGYNRRQETTVLAIVSENRVMLLERWDEYCG